MNWDDFYKSVKAGQYLNLYLFCGPEEWNKREALAALRKAVLPAGLEQLNDATLDGATAQTIIDSAETLPVMCERRIVVVRDWVPLTGGKSKNEEAESERMLAWIKDMPDSCIVIFYMTAEIDGRKKLCKALKACEGYIEFNYLSGAVLQKWCGQQLKSFGKKIAQDAVNEMTLMAGQELTRLAGELQKLAAYTGEANEITAADVRAVVAPSPEYSVFLILDRLMEGKLAEAVEITNSVLQNQPSVRLIAMFSNQLRIDAHMKLTIECGGSMAETLKMLNVSDYRSKYILRQIRDIPAETFKNCYRMCVDADYDIKSGNIRDRAALDSLMLKISQAFAATKSLHAASKR